MGSEMKGQKNKSPLMSDQMQTKSTWKTFWHDQKGIQQAALEENPPKGS